MKIADIRSLSDEELVSKGNNLAEELFKLRFKHGIRQLENTSKLKELRKNVARIETVKSEKRIAAQTV